MKIRFTVALLLFVAVSFGQATKTDPIDGQAWYGAGIKFDLPKKWSVEFDYERRYQNNRKDFYGSYCSFEVERKLGKYFTAIGEYRLAIFDDGKSNRFSFGGSGDKKWTKKFKTSARLLFFNKIWDDIDPTIVNEKSFFWRFRLGAEYEVHKKINLYATTEPIMEFGGNNFVDNWRNTIGVKGKLYKKTTMDLFYIYRSDFRKATYNRYYNILGATLKYTIKPKGKKKV